VVALALRAYRRGTAAIQLVADRTALLVIDMQDEFVRPGWTPYWIPEATRQVPRLARLLTTCRARGAPVLHTAFAASHRGLDRPGSPAVWVCSRADRRRDRPGAEDNVISCACRGEKSGLPC
jgi:nicotinamidase-related amidase